MKISRRSLLAAAGATAMTLPMGTAFAQKAEFVYKYANNLPVTHPMNVRAKEMADAIIINKADGDNIQRAKLARAEYRNALHLFSAPDSGWIPTVETCSSRTGDGIENVWETILKYRELTLANGHFANRRLKQAKETMMTSINASLKQMFFDNPQVKERLTKLESELMESKISPYIAAQQLMEEWIGNINHRDTEFTEA